jgi:cobalamin biosynthetic protein CobC
VKDAPPDLPDHGGDLVHAELLFGHHDEWLDLSTGINPWPYPFSPPSREAWTRLPDGAVVGRLLAAAADTYGAPTPDHVVAAPGSQALIQLLPRLRPASDVAILGPTYGEHEASWSAAGHRVRVVSGADELRDCEVAVLCNPNNPDGRVLDPEMLRRLAGELAARGGWLVVDEAFADVAPGMSLAPGVDQPGCIVLRSFGKFFGLAGVRLGFALAAPAICASIRQGLGPWAVSGPACRIGAEALGDGAWMAETRSRLARQRLRLDRVLHEAGLEVAGGTDLYRLVLVPDAARIHRVLGAAGILVRRFEDHPRWLRFGLPGDDAALGRLAAALACCRVPVSQSP